MFLKFFQFKQGYNYIRRKGLLGVEKNEKTLRGTGIPVLNKKQKISFYRSKDGEGV